MKSLIINHVSSPRVINIYIRRKLQITGILDKVDEYRRIQTEPNLLEILPLQTTGKENNWKTEETLARATVTLETDQMVQSLISTMMIMIMMMIINI